ncbi:GntR family transcriptional regulator [Leptospira interrogans]
MTKAAKFPDAKSADSLSAEAYRAIEERIVTLVFPPGSTWSEAAIAEAVEIGRTPVREALQRLAVGQVVHIVRRHGIVISPIDLQTQLLVIETRRELERLVAVRAARRVLASDKRALSKLADELEEVGRTQQIREFLGMQFIYKRLLADIAGNPFAAAALEPLHILTRRFYFRYHTDLEDLPQVTKLHATLLRSVASGEEAAASQSCTAMIDYAEQLTRRIVERER